MSLLSRLFGTGRRSVTAPSREEASPTPAAQVADAAKDPWFWVHYDEVPQIVLPRVPAECRESGRTILDFGCGDGLITFGIASKVEAQVIGIDLTRAFVSVQDFAESNLGSRTLPSNLSFQQVHLGQPLPFADDCIDLIHSWSTFEHVADVKGVLAELHRIAKPGGALFIQIDPLFYGPYGSHLKRLIDEPWAHLLYSEEQYLAMVASATDHVPPQEQDGTYRKNSFEDLKLYLLAEYRSLNRITADELLELVAASGFEILSTTLIKADESPDPRLLERYPLGLLMTSQIVLVAKKPKCRH